MECKTPPLNIENIRNLFPALQQTVYGKKLTYLDNAATTQKPQSVLDRLLNYYYYDNANVHRGMHALATRATINFEKTRSLIQKFINATHVEEIIFTQGTTAAINLVAATYGTVNIQEGDEIIISQMEHHANIVPWQRLCRQKKALLKVIPISNSGLLQMDTFEELLTSRTKIVAINYVSNTLGTINPIQEIITKSHIKGAIVIIDGAQAIAHLPIDVVKLDCDFFAFSAHKAYGPTGVGCLYGKKELLEKMPPYQVGGEMVQKVTLDDATYSGIPYKFEAGTPPVANIIAFQKAIDFITQVGYTNIITHEKKLLLQAYNGLKQIGGIRFFGTAPHKIGILSFLVKDMHPLDVGMLLDAQGIAVRTGHCCTQPLMHRFGIEGVVRVSFCIYNTEEEVSCFIQGINKIIQQHSS